MKLYYHPLSSYSRKVLVALHEKQIELEREMVDMFRWESMSKYRQDVNPLGKLPQLVADDGTPIREATIIIEYLDARFPDRPRMIPADPEQARETRYYERVADLYVIDPAVTLLLQGMKPEERRNPEKIEGARLTLRRVLPMLDERLAGREHLAADGFTVADIAAAAGVCWLPGVGVDLGGYSHLGAWHQRVMARGSWRKVMQEAEPYLHVLA